MFSYIAINKTVARKKTDILFISLLKTNQKPTKTKNTYGFYKANFVLNTYRVDLHVNHIYLYVVIAYLPNFTNVNSQFKTLGQFKKRKQDINYLQFQEIISNIFKSDSTSYILSCLAISVLA